MENRFTHHELEVLFSVVQLRKDHVAVMRQRYPELTDSYYEYLALMKKIASYCNETPTHNKEG